MTTVSRASDIRRKAMTMRRFDSNAEADRHDAEYRWAFRLAESTS
jgi:hypothetical protein